MSGKQQEPQPRHLRIGIIGSIGSGKSTLAGLLGERWGVVPITENHMANPHLDKFYNEDPKKYAFISQVWFLTDKISKLANFSGQFTEVLDPALQMDFIYSETLNKIGLLTDAELETYWGLAQALREEKGIYEPDLFIVLNAGYNWLFERVQERGRGLERKITPDYLKALSETVSRWVSKNRSKVSLIQFDSSHYNFSLPGDAQEVVLGRIESTLATMSTKISIGRDGRPLIFPSFSSGKYGYDVTPGLSPEERLLRGR